MLHLRAPLRIHRLRQAENTQIERKVGYINKFTVSAKVSAAKLSRTIFIDSKVFAMPTRRTMFRLCVHYER